MDFGVSGNIAEQNYYSQQQQYEQQQMMHQMYNSQNQNMQGSMGI
jgi:hypothetical protein